MAPAGPAAPVTSGKLFKRAARDFPWAGIPPATTAPRAADCHALPLSPLCPPGPAALQLPLRGPAAICLKLKGLGLFPQEQAEEPEPKLVTARTAGIFLFAFEPAQGAFKQFCGVLVA